MVECPRCGIYMSGLKSECDTCGYQPNWEDYYDYDLMDNNSIDCILKFNSYEVIDIVREQKQMPLNIVGSIIFCPECKSVMEQQNILVNCHSCGYSTKLPIDKTKLLKEIWDENYVTSNNLIENFSSPDFMWFLLGNDYLDKKYI